MKPIPAGATVNPAGTDAAMLNTLLPSDAGFKATISAVASD